MKIQEKKTTELFGKVKQNKKRCTITDMSNTALFVILLIYRTIPATSYTEIISINEGI